MVFKSMDDATLSGTDRFGSKSLQDRRQLASGQIGAQIADMLQTWNAGTGPTSVEIKRDE
jgi:hypothetical protein